MFDFSEVITIEACLYSYVWNTHSISQIWSCFILLTRENPKTQHFWPPTTSNIREFNVMPESLWFLFTYASSQGILLDSTNLTERNT